MVNRPFRFTVLAQPRWLTGQFVEPYLVRLPLLRGSGAVNVFGLGMDVAAATKTLRRMERSGDPAMRRAAKELRAHQLGGLLIGGRGATVRRRVEDVPALAWAAVVRDLPVIKQTADLLRVLPDAFFRANRVIESFAQRAAVGGSIRRDVQEFTGSWMKAARLQADAVDEMARGLVDTATQRRFKAAADELLGKYDGFPPAVRAVIQGPMPFVPWTIASRPD